TNKGRIDAVWKLKDAIIIIEVKYSARKSVVTLLDEAMTQIDDRGYYERYLADGLRIILLAVAFAGKKTGVRIGEV
ncbi:MAG: PD-(D/E)XK nuclease domain-containing protein, partial [Tannerella sp.]|nr:PD-(D/E)XK nuclease domain-containing protein [Tannerella sp.]